MEKLILCPTKGDNDLDPSNDSGDEKTLLGYPGGKTSRTWVYIQCKR